MKKSLLLLVLCASVLLAACSKDENNNERTYEEFILAPTDVELLGLFGKVKTYTESNWYNCTVENNKVNTNNGFIDRKTVIVFNIAGYITSKKDYYYKSSTKELMLSNYHTYRYDSHNRLLERLHYDNDTGQIDGKHEFIYDDVNKTVTQYMSSLWYGVFIKDTDYYVFQQNQYGRMDTGNYEKKKSETRGNKYVANYDSHGNINEKYSILYNYLADYMTCSYEYYK